MIRSENIFFCIRNRPSPWKINKKQQVGTVLSGRAKRSSRRHHAAFAAVRTGADVDFPDSFQQFCHTHASITAFVFLAALNTEDQLQVLLFHPVVQETIVTDFLKSGRQDMHQVPADKLLVAQPYYTARAAGFLRPCRESYVGTVYGKQPAV